LTQTIPHKRSAQATRIVAGADSQEFQLEPSDNRRLASLCGPRDQHLRQIETGLAVKITSRGNRFRVDGPTDHVVATGKLIQELYRSTASQPLDASFIHLFLQRSGVEQLVESQRQAAVSGDSDDLTVAEAPVTIRTPHGKVRPRGENQANYVQAVRVHDICFGVGPAGTGKTYLAVACAVEALESESIRRLVLVRPAVEAGERLGFLPGDLAQKVDPYLRPLYDALYEMLGFEKVGKLIERQVIEVAPLAYMRGRTLSEAFIILDEAQNTTPEQMKMFLTRIGFGSTAVITGDVTQIDLPRGSKSGLLHAREVLSSIEGISFTHFNTRDVVRHQLVAKILDAYEEHENPRDSRQALPGTDEVLSNE
jgi:phosphate starvation-inducible PhoH-like protein